MRDERLMEYRSLTSSWEFKQNANVTVGLAWFTKSKAMAAAEPKATR